MSDIASPDFVCCCRGGGTGATVAHGAGFLYDDYYAVALYALACCRRRWWAEYVIPTLPCLFIRRFATHSTIVAPELSMQLSIVWNVCLAKYINTRLPLYVIPSVVSSWLLRPYSQGHQGYVVGTNVTALRREIGRVVELTAKFRLEWPCLPSLLEISLLCSCHLSALSLLPGMYKGWCSFPLSVPFVCASSVFKPWVLDNISILWTRSSHISSPQTWLLTPSSWALRHFLIRQKRTLRRLFQHSGNMGRPRKDAPPDTLPKKERLTLTQLAGYDDILTDALVDHVSTIPLLNTFTSIC